MFKSLSKLRGKRKEVTEITELFTELFNESFPDLVESTSGEAAAKEDLFRVKRPRQSDVEVSAPPNKKPVVAEDSKNSKLSKEVKVCSIHI